MLGHASVAGLISVEHARDTDRLVAWADELQAAHERLREALRVARESAAGGEDVAARDLLLYCHGFCVALQGHHTAEDGGLFPELAARHPSLQPVIAILEQDHAMIATLLTGLERALRSNPDVLELDRHLEGLAAIMESNFRFEERKLLDTLAMLRLDAEPERLLGPL